MYHFKIKYISSHSHLLVAGVYYFEDQFQVEGLVNRILLYEYGLSPFFPPQTHSIPIGGEYTGYDDDDDTHTSDNCMGIYSSYFYFSVQFVP